MYKKIDKDTIQANMKDIMESEFFHDLYNKILFSDDLHDMEEKSAGVFNAALFACQLVEDKYTIRNVILELMEESLFVSEGLLYVNAYDDEMYVDILKKYDPFYMEDGHEKMIDRLKHGVAVHFTTPRIMEKIEREGFLKAHDSMFSREIEQKILSIEKYQMEHQEEYKDSGLFLLSGFGFSKGISMSAQTPSFWMHHTPESLTFLFGGTVFTRNREGAMKHIAEVIAKLPEDQRIEMMEIAENIWDELIGDDKSLGCVLIDRDSLEYETVTYWNETPPRVEEIRPYRDGTLNSLMAMEEQRYEKDIPVSGLRFIKVPSIYQLERYRKDHLIDNKDRFGRGISVSDDTLEDESVFEDIFSDEVYENAAVECGNNEVVSEGRYIDTVGIEGGEVENAGSDDYDEI